MTVCFVRSSSELLQGSHVLWPPYLRVHTWAPTVLGVKTALVDEDYPLFSSRGGHSAHSFVFLIYVDMSAQRNRPYCELACYAVFHELFCIKKDVFLPIFWRCKTIFVTLHHQTKEEVRRRRKRNASLRKRRGKKNRCRKSQRKVPDIDPKGGRWRHET